ncbi:MAG: hypothetical protein FJ029_16160 [Actinobacteria bacterium]|nr:hypothetical protein [Actinomycetota bacterium]
MGSLRLELGGAGIELVAREHVGIPAGVTATLVATGAEDTAVLEASLR